MTRVHLRPDLARNRPPEGWRLPWPATTTGKAGAPDPRRLAPGGVHRCRCPGFAVILWRRGQAGCRPLGAAARFNATIAAGKSAVARATRSIYLSGGRGGSASAGTAATATTLAQAAPQDAAPATPAALPDQTQLLQTMARDLANLERNIEQLQANQQQMASDNSKAIEELKANQEEIKRDLARTPTGPAQDVATAGAARSGLAQARAAAATGARAAKISIPAGMDLRRLVAADTRDYRNTRGNNVSTTRNLA